MKYTPATIAKALFAAFSAFTAAAVASGHGVDLSGLDAGQWMAAVGAALVAGGGVFTIPNKEADGAPASPADQAITGIQNTVQQAQTAQSDLDRVRDAAAGALANVPVLGPLATDILKNLPRF